MARSLINPYIPKMRIACIGALCVTSLLPVFAQAFEEAPAVSVTTPGPRGAVRQRPLPEQVTAVSRAGWEDTGHPVSPATRDLLAAVRAGDVDGVRKQLNAGAVANAADEAGQRPLLVAIGDGQVEMVRLLLQRGASPNAKGSGGRYPLGLAAAQGHLEIVSLLLKAGAMQAVRGDTGAMPIHEAARFDRVAVLRALLAADAGAIALLDRQGLQPLAVAARAGSLGALDLLLTAGATVEDTDAKGQTALYWAIYDQQGEAEAFLVQHGADYRRLVAKPAGG